MEVLKKKLIKELEMIEEVERKTDFKELDYDTVELAYKLFKTLYYACGVEVVVGKHKDQQAKMM